MVKVLFFAQLREKMGIAECEVNIAEPQYIDQVIDTLCVLNEQFSCLREPHLFVAINHEITSRDARVCDGDELAFFPAVTGG